MSQVSRPMQIALAATMAFALVWFVALRPKSSSGEQVAAPAPAPAGQTTQAAPARPAAEQPAARSGAPSGGGEQAARTPHAGPRVRAVKAALRDHKAVAIAFVDPGTADARAVAREVRHVSAFGDKAVALAVPIAKLSDFAFITNKVEVTVAPTVVIVDRRHQATTIVGYADRGEIEQRLADALAAKRQR